MRADAQSKVPREPSRPPIHDSVAVWRLKEVIRRTNPELAARRLALEAAHARLRATGFAAPATLSGEVEEVPSGVDFGSAQSVRVDVSRELFSGGRRAARRAVVQREVERARIEVELAERRLIANVDQLLTRTVAGAMMARRLAAEDSLLSAAEDGLRARFAVGDARYVEVLRLRTERLRVQADIASARTDARTERRSLVALVAAVDVTSARDTLVAAAIAAGLADLLHAPLPPVLDLDSLVARSAAVRYADIEVARARAARRLIRAEQRPILMAMIGAQRFAADESGFSVGAIAGASVTLPFTARRANQAARASAGHEVAAAEAARRAALATARATLSAARDRYETALERLVLYDAALLRGAREERESALAAYRGGELSLIELLDFERALARAEIGRLRGRVEAADALADLLSGATEFAGESRDRTVFRREGEP